MKFSIEWLKYFLETDASVQEIADTLNAIGHEVEGIEDPAEKLAGFTIAEVLTAGPHPDADKLQVLSVSTGEGEPLQVVCGAPNARAGMKGVLGQPGAVVPANGMELKKSKIRGVESNGMMCSVRELELGEEHDGIIELPSDAPVGASFAEYHAASPILDVAITPDRPDCMGVMGIARDLAAAGLGTYLPVEADEIAGEGACPVEIRTDDAEGCPAFYGRVIRGVSNGASPEWMQRRLKAAGQRPISALVDCTNYLMFATGRPAHVYDLRKLSGPVIARRAKNGETVEALAVNVGAAGEPVSLSIRPERVLLNGASVNCPNRFTGRVAEFIYLGDHIRIRLEVCGVNDFFVKQPIAEFDSALRVGDVVPIGWHVEHVRALDPLQAA